jgi:hypothetical protein
MNMFSHITHTAHYYNSAGEYDPSAAAGANQSQIFAMQRQMQEMQATIHALQQQQQLGAAAAAGGGSSSSAPLSDSGTSASRNMQQLQEGEEQSSRSYSDAPQHQHPAQEHDVGMEHDEHEEEEVPPGGLTFEEKHQLRYTYTT